MSEIYTAIPATVKAYENGRVQGRYRYTYINPRYSAEELAAWCEGYKAGKLEAQDGRTDKLDTSTKEYHPGNG